MRTPQRIPTTTGCDAMCCGKIAKGATGLTKAALRLDRADDQTISSRRDACRSCERSERRSIAGVVQVRTCAACGCLIRAKSLVASERCPLGKWLV